MQEERPERKVMLGSADGRLPQRQLAGRQLNKRPKPPRIGHAKRSACKSSSLYPSHPCHMMYAHLELLLDIMRSDPKLYSRQHIASQKTKHRSNFLMMYVALTVAADYQTLE